MHVVALAFGLPLGLWVGALPRPINVLVPDETAPEACFFAERAAAVISLTPGLRLLRGRINDGETLEAARQRSGAEVAVRGTRTVKEKSEEASLELARPDRPIERRSLTGWPFDRVEAGLEMIWPKDLPPLARIGAPGAASPRALEARCKKDMAAAYAQSGTAIGRSLREAAPPPVPDPKPPPLGHRWAKAAELKRQHRLKEAAALMRGIVLGVAKNESIPTWRHERDEGSREISTLDLYGTTLLGFAGGDFVALDLKSGIDLWRKNLGRALPHLVDLGDGLVLALVDTEAVALDLKDGKMRWRVPVESPFPEIAKANGRIFVGGAEQVVAIDRVKGEIVWRYDPLQDMISGPMLSGSRLVLAANSQVILLDAASGLETKRIDVGDEISAPLALSGKGSIWALVGGDQAVRIDPERALLELRASDLPGMEWPPAPIGEQLVVAFRRAPQKRFLAYLDASAKNGLRRLYPGATPPLAPLPSLSGVVHLQERPAAIFARDTDGLVLWKAPEPKKVNDLSVQADTILVAQGTRALVLEPKRGAILEDFDLGEPVKKVVMGPEGGAALVESGAIYGLPSKSDPRQRAALARARLDLAQILLESGESAAASAMARLAVDRDPATSRLAPKPEADKTQLATSDDLDALVLLARTEEKLRAPDAAERWRQVAIAAPKNDPLQQDAARALLSVVGIAARVSLDHPIKRAIGGAGGVMVIRTEEGILGLALEAKAIVTLWKKADAELSPFGEGVVRVGDDLIKADDGTQIRHLEGEAPLLVKSTILRKKAAELAREQSDGKELWSTSLDGASLSPADASLKFIALWDAAKGDLSFLRATTGERVSTAAIGEPIVLASISGQKAMLELQKKLMIVDVESGKREAVLPIAAGEVVSRIDPIEKGWLIAGKQKLKAVDRTKGRVLYQVTLPFPIDRLAISPVAQTAVALLTDGSLVAADLAKGQVRGRVKLGKIVDLESSGAMVLALEGSGALLLIDASRGLLREVPQVRSPGRQSTSP